MGSAEKGIFHREVWGRFKRAPHSRWREVMVSGSAQANMVLKCSESSARDIGETSQKPPIFPSFELLGGYILGNKRNCTARNRRKRITITRTSAPKKQSPLTSVEYQSFAAGEAVSGNPNQIHPFEYWVQIKIPAVRDNNRTRASRIPQSRRMAPSEAGISPKST